MRVLLTGAGGFIGANICRTLLKQGHAVAAVIRSSASRPRSRIDDVLNRIVVVDGPLEDIACRETDIRAFAPEIAIHCAWSGIAGDTRADARLQSGNFLATSLFLEACLRANIRHWVGIGSQAEYGTQNRRLDEAAAVAPDSLYGAAKSASFFAARSLCDQNGIRFSWMRVFSVYGPDDTPSFLIPSLISILLRGERPQLTEGSQRWDFLHVQDAASAICHVALHEEASGIFNLGSGEARSVKSVAENVRDAIDPSLPLGLGEKPLSRHAARLVEANPGRLFEYGWRPRISWHDGIRQTIDWHRARLIEAS